jgi:hypothetical protein
MNGRWSFGAKAQHPAVHDVGCCNHVARRAPPKICAPTPWNSQAFARYGTHKRAICCMIFKPL